jgi:hypothetical protein
MDDRSNILLRSAEPAPARRNIAAIVSFVAAALSLAGLVLGPWVTGAVFAFLGFVPAIVSGHVARRQLTKRPGAFSNPGMATFGLAIGYLGLFLTAFVVISMAFGFIRVVPVD